MTYSLLNMNTKNRKNMSNISKRRREEMLAYLHRLKEIHTGDEDLIAISKIEEALLEKKYGLVWEEHREHVDEMIKHHIQIFCEYETKKIEAERDREYNFLLEGDNLYSLKLLEKNHRGEIDVIYIEKTIA